MTLFFDDYPVQSATYGNVDTIPDYLKPKVKRLLHTVNDSHVIMIDTEGKITLYSNDLTAYVSGNIFTCVTYISD